MHLRRSHPSHRGVKRHHQYDWTLGRAECPANHLARIKFDVVFQYKQVIIYTIRYHSLHENQGVMRGLACLRKFKQELLPV